MAAGHVLVLEPDAAMRTEIERVLRSTDWSVEAAATSGEAVAAASATPPDVVALDVRSVQAPRLIAAELRIRCGRRLPILAMDSMRDDQLADDVAAFDSVLLPAELEELPVRLRRDNGRAHTQPESEGASVHRSQRTPATSERSWRYKTLKTIDGTTYEDGNPIDARGRLTLREHADLLGESGWELVGVAASEWVFKRELKGGARRPVRDAG